MMIIENENITSSEMRELCVCGCENFYFKSARKRLHLVLNLTLKKMTRSVLFPSPKSN